MSGQRRRGVVLLLVVLVLTPAVSGCFAGTSRLLVGASAPRDADGMTIFVAKQPGVLDRLEDTKVTYVIKHGETIVYPPYGRGGDFRLEGKTGSVFVPYDRFVTGNGDYDVIVTHGGEESRVRVSIQKWVNYVFLHPFDRGSLIRVDAVLAAGTGGNPDDRILTEGDLGITLRYRGLDGKADRVLDYFEVRTRHDRTSTTLEIPRSRLSAGPGYYSFDPVFHNAEALNNLHVPPDPTMAYRQPPWNWIHITN